MPGVTTGKPNDEVYNTHILDLSRFLTTSLQIIRKYIPEQVGKRSSSCYHLLIVVYGNPCSTAGCIRSIFHSSSGVIDKKLTYLLLLGHIKEVGKPRLIIPFQRYKVDTAYKITDKGLKVIRNIFTGAGVKL